MRRSTTKWLIAVIALVLVFSAVVPTVAQASGGGTTLISGKDGKDGQDGADGITPILRINEETGEWEYSYTGGRYWTSMGVKAGSSYDADNLLNPEYINQAWYANFGDKGGGAVIWEEKTLKFTSADNYFGLNNQKFNLTVGIEVDVVWNGTVYTCIPFEQAGEIFLGNRELMVPGGSHAAVYNVPFCFTGMRDTFNMVKKSTDTAENITVKIVTHVYDTYNKLDVDYLPDEVVTTDELPALGGGTSLDVTAQPGQTIIVKEVDENGKPTKWESAEYQERTHWMGEKVMFERTFANNEASGKNIALDSPAMGLTVGKTYNVIINGVTYECVAQSGRNAELGVDLIWLGNPVIVGGAANDMPFCLADVVGVNACVATGMATGLNTVSVVGADEVNAIPTEYLTEGFPFQIAITASVSDGATEYFCGVGVASMMELFNSGIELKLIVATIGTGAYYFYSMVAYESTELGGRFTFASLSGLDGRTPLFLVLEPQENGAYAVQGKNLQEA